MGIHINGGLNLEPSMMRFKQCYKPPMTGNAKDSTDENGGD